MAMHCKNLLHKHILIKRREPIYNLTEVVADDDDIVITEDFILGTMWGALLAVISIFAAYFIMF